MNFDERRLLLDRTFDKTLQTVLDAFLYAGFTITPSEAGDLQAPPHPGPAMRYALLEATLPELSAPLGVATARPLLSCRVSVYELNGSCSLVTAENRLVRYPLLASLATRIGDRTAAALRRIARGEIGAAA
jgi:hypothetical protein